MIKIENLGTKKIFRPFKLNIHFLSVRWAGSHSLGKIIERFGGIMPLVYNFLFLTFIGIAQYNHEFFNHSSFAEARLLVSSSLLPSAKEASMGFGAVNRSRACLTASRRTSN